MDKWTFHRYQEPRLHVDQIDHQESSPIVTLRVGRQSYRIAFDGPEAAAEIAAELSTLRDSRAPLWSVLRQSAPDTNWFVLGNFLDTHSLIYEASDRSAEELAIQAERVQDCIADTVYKDFESLPENRRAIAATHAAFLRSELKRARNERGFIDIGRDPFKAQEQPNFFLGLLSVEFEYLQGASPLTLAAVDTLLARISGDNDNPINVETGLGFSEASGVYDLLDVERHLSLVGYAVAMSASDEAARFQSPPMPELSLTSGLEFMRQTELLARETLAMWGPSRYLSQLEELKDAESPVIAGTYLEQYHVTRRLVEIVAPLLCKRLAPPLRQMMFKYFSEELGHEELESKTCEAFGVASQVLEKMLPLPLHYAFIDALTTLAQLDPIALFASVMVIEGLFGEPPNLSQRLALVTENNPGLSAASKDHDELNETLNHNSISRDAFESIVAMSVPRQLKAIHRVLFLLELNHRAWNEVLDFYGRQETLQVRESPWSLARPSALAFR